MALLTRPLNVNDSYWGTIYTFENVGDVFENHVHTTEDTNHITVLLSGSVRVTGHPKHDGVILPAKPGGTIVNWQINEEHGFVALEAGTTIMNLLKVKQ